MKKLIIIMLSALMIAAASVGVTLIIKNSKENADSGQKPTDSHTFSSVNSSNASEYGEGSCSEDSVYSSAPSGGDSSFFDSASSTSTSSVDGSSVDSSSDNFESSSFVENSSADHGGEPSSSAEEELSSREKALIVKSEIEGSIPALIDSTGGGDIELMQKGSFGGDISWSSNTLLFSEKGVYRSVIADFEVILTAKFLIDGIEFSFDFSLILKKAEQSYPSVSQVFKAAEDSGEIIYEVKECLSYIVGFATAHSSSGDICGIYLSDGKALATLTGVGGQLSLEGGRYFLSGVELKVGMGIYLKGLECSGNVFTCADGTVGRIDSRDNPTDYLKLDEYLVIDGREALESFAQSITDLASTSQVNHKAIKFVATKDKPIVFTGVESDYFINFFYPSGNDIITNDYTFTLGDMNGSEFFMGTHAVALGFNLGKKWVEENTHVTLDDNGFNPNLTTPVLKATKFEGEFYAVFEYVGNGNNPYVYFSVLSAFSLTPIK